MTRKRKLRPEEAELWGQVARSTTPLDRARGLDSTRPAPKKPEPAPKEAKPRIEPFRVGQNARATPAGNALAPSISASLAADPLADFIHANPTIVMLALGFLLLIGTTLIADGFGVHVPKGYIYAAMAFSAPAPDLVSRNAQCDFQSF